MKIAIIGTGNVGRALGTSIKRAGNEVIFAGRNPEKTEATADDLDATPTASPADAAAAGDAVILAVPYSAGREVASEIAPHIGGKLVIDSTNPLADDYQDLVTAAGPSGAENFASWLPGARVVKAFNTLFATIQADPGTHGVEVDAMYATDDEQAKQEMTELLRSMGFRPIYVGPLARARELEAIAFLNIQLQMANQGDWKTVVTLVGAPRAATAAGRD